MRDEALERNNKSVGSNRGKRTSMCAEAPERNAKSVGREKSDRMSMRDEARA